MTFINPDMNLFNNWICVIILLLGQILRVELDEEKNIYVKYFLRTLIFLQFMIFLKYNLDLYFQTG